MSRRSDLIPFKDAQQEAWMGIFQQQHVHCWDAEMHQGLERGWRDAPLSNPGRDVCSFWQHVCIVVGTGERWGERTYLEQMRAGGSARDLEWGGMFRAIQSTISSLLLSSVVLYSNIKINSHIHFVARGLSAALGAVGRSGRFAPPLWLRSGSAIAPESPSTSSMGPCFFGRPYHKMGRRVCDRNKHLAYICMFSCFF